MLALVVDDSRTTRTTLACALSSFGFDTVEADNVRTGLEALRAMPVPPDVVVVDGSMPELDGLEFVSEVRSQPAWRTVRIMMVTGDSDQRRIVRAFAAGAHEYLIKPFTVGTIHDRLRLLGLVGEATGEPRSRGYTRRETGTGLTASAEHMFAAAGA